MTASVQNIGYFRPQAAAVYCSISLRTLNRWTKARKVPVIRPGARAILYSRADLDEALRRYRISAIGED